jgi:hypothetical protein
LEGKCEVFVSEKSLSRNRGHTLVLVKWNEVLTDLCNLGDMKYGHLEEYVMYALSI